jgi:hypothetical protein
MVARDTDGHIRWQFRHKLPNHYIAFFNHPHLELRVRVMPRIVDTLHMQKYELDVSA